MVMKEIKDIGAMLESNSNNPKTSESEATGGRLITALPRFSTDTTYSGKAGVFHSDFVFSERTGPSLNTGPVFYFHPSATSKTLLRERVKKNSSHE